jgi:hypothetical protein
LKESQASLPTSISFFPWETYGKKAEGMQGMILTVIEGTLADIIASVMRTIAHPNFGLSIGLGRAVHSTAFPGINTFSG